jgi:hypothetical protein
MLALHVDNLILAYRNDDFWAGFIQTFVTDNCKMNNLDEVSQFIGVVTALLTVLRNLK